MAENATIPTQNPTSNTPDTPYNLFDVCVNELCYKCWHQHEYQPMFIAKKEKYQAKFSMLYGLDCTVQALIDVYFPEKPQEEAQSQPNQ